MYNGVEIRSMQKHTVERGNRVAQSSGLCLLGGDYLLCNSVRKDTRVACIADRPINKYEFEIISTQIAV